MARRFVALSMDTCINFVFEVITTYLDQLAVLQYITHLHLFAVINALSVLESTQRHVLLLILGER